jgi:hypothetical protein
VDVAVFPLVWEHPRVAVSAGATQLARETIGHIHCEGTALRIWMGRSHWIAIQNPFPDG